jgi:Asp-tRNA(Asn)/Glu-tRNA(Gln) amidotransferase A subunit family amidase
VGWPRLALGSYRCRRSRTPGCYVWLCDWRPYWLPDPQPSFLAAAVAGKHELKKLRVAFATTLPPLGEAQLVCQQAVQETVQLLEELGHIVEPGCPNFTGLIGAFYNYLAKWRGCLWNSGRGTRTDESLAARANWFCW